jgi:hypothetical protein
MEKKMYQKNDIDDIDTKVPDTRISIKLCQKRGKTYLSWEAASIINNINSNYYKQEILDNIEFALSKNVNPEDIVIFTKPLSLFKEHDITDITLGGKELRHLYSLGDPISLVPNDKIHDLAFVFNTFRTVDEILYKTHESAIGKNSIHTYYALFLEKGVSDFKDKLIESSIRITDGNKNTISQIQQIIDNKISDYQKYYKDDQDNIKTIKELLSSNEKEITLKTLEQTYKRYFASFFKQFSELTRPVVAVFNGSHAILLGKHHISKEYSNNLTLTLKDVTQVNPTDFIFLSGISLLWHLIKAFPEYQLKQLEIEEKQLAIKERELNIQIKEKILARMDEKDVLQVIEKLENLLHQLSTTNTNYTQNPYGQNIAFQIAQETEKLIDATHQTLVDAGIEIDLSNIRLDVHA